MNNDFNLDFGQQITCRNLHVFERITTWRNLKSKSFHCFQTMKLSKQRKTKCHWQIIYLSAARDPPGRSCMVSDLCCKNLWEHLHNLSNKRSHGLWFVLCGLWFVVWGLLWFLVCCLPKNKQKPLGTFAQYFQQMFPKIIPNPPQNDQIWVKCASQIVKNRDKVRA